MSFAKRAGARTPAEPCASLYAPARLGLCRDIPHWWWPLRPGDQKSTGVRALCLRCGTLDGRRPVQALGTLAVTATTRRLGG